MTTPVTDARFRDAAHAQNLFALAEIGKGRERHEDRAPDEEGHHHDTAYLIARKPLNH